MADQGTEVQTVCVICSSPAAQNCENCQAPHCAKHVLDDSCVACSAQLWALERKQVRRAAVVYSLGAVPLAIVALMLAADGVFAFLGFTVFLGLLLGFLALPKIMGPVFRRAHAKRELSVTSQPMLPPTPSEVPMTEDVHPANAAEYDHRKRNNRRQQVKSKTTILGSFYKIP